MIRAYKLIETMLFNLKQSTTGMVQIQVLDLPTYSIYLSIYFTEYIHWVILIMKQSINITGEIYPLHVNTYFLSIKMFENYSGYLSWNAILSLQCAV